MSKKYETIAAMKKTGVIAVLRSKSEEQALAVARSCMAGGIDFIEITFSTPGADRVISSIARSGEFAGIKVGAGTVMDATTARLAILAGAQYVVAPTFDAEVAKICNLHAVPYIPGVMTINEIAEAMKYGCDLVKLFPASEFKTGFIKAVHGPIPQVDVMVTGGVGMANTAEWIAAGAVCVGIGGNLTKVTEDMTVNEQGVYPEIVATAQAYLEEVAKGRA